MLILFLNELSTDSNELELSEARQRALGLQQILSQIRKRHKQVALNSQVSLKNTFVDQRYSIYELLSGDEYRDELRFLKGFANRSPMSADMSTAFDLEMEEVDYHYQGETCIALGWADQLGTGVVSFFKLDFSEESLAVEKSELDDAAEIITSMIDVRNFATPDHVASHAEWLQNSAFEWLSETASLWEQREALFPHLRFLDRTQSDIDALRVSGASYHLVLHRLNQLNQDIAKWVEAGTGWPEFSSKATPEAQGRKQLCKVNDNGQEHDFDWHLRFTGGMAGRIHFRICANEQKAIIAYLGRKLEAPIVR